MAGKQRAMTGKRVRKLERQVRERTDDYMAERKRLLKAQSAFARAYGRMKAAQMAYTGARKVLMQSASAPVGERIEEDTAEPVRPAPPAPARRDPRKAGPTRVTQPLAAEAGAEASGDA